MNKIIYLLNIFCLFRKLTIIKIILTKFFKIINNKLIKRLKYFLKFSGKTN